MSTAGLVARLRASERPAVWLLAATACRAARRVSRHRSRWSFRLGYALERLDEAREASREAAAERRWSRPGGGVRGEARRRLRLARRRERGGDWPGAVAAYWAALAHDDSHPTWWYRLGRCLREVGDLPGAAEAARQACRLDDTNPRWFGLLADAEEAAGDLPAAAAARERGVQLAGAADPRWRVQLAALHEQVGQWDQAQQILRENVAQHPDHALSYRRLGEVGLKLAHWGGTFTGTLAGRDRGGFRFDQSFAGAGEQAREALERAAALEPAKTAWRAALAEARLAAGDRPGAIRLYETALNDAEQSTGRWVLAVKQRWQFQLESIYHQLGKARVEDPLFECTVESGDPAPDNAPVGLFNARTIFSGLAITGLVAAGDADSVEILLDGALLRRVNLGGQVRRLHSGPAVRSGPGQGRGDGFFPQFSLEIRRATLASFPRHGQLSVQTPDGTRLRVPGGADRLEVAVPHGNGRLPDIIAAGGKLDKKGSISPSLAETKLRQERYLEIYAKVRDFFEQELGRPLLLMYGTLLGYYREGDFIPGDDDFDAGYVSDRTDPVAVKEETLGLVRRLVQAGFTISFNRKGRLFRIQLEREATDRFHLDVRPLWFQRGNVWLHNHCSFPSRREQFLPAAEGELRGVRVLAPRDTEAFLRGHYGPGWKVPDPGFMYYTSEIDPAVLDNLSKALLTVREYKEFAARLRREVGDSPPAGRLVSVGSQDLYPLDEFLA